MVNKRDLIVKARILARNLFNASEEIDEQASILDYLDDPSHSQYKNAVRKLEDLMDTWCVAREP